MEDSAVSSWVFWGGGGGVFLTIQALSPNFWPTFHFFGGGGGGGADSWPAKNWYSWQNEFKILEA